MIFIFLIFSLFISSSAQDGGCLTAPPHNLPTIPQYSITPKTISFYFHVVRDDNGHGGYTDSQVQEQISLLFGDLSNWSITGVEVGREIVRSSYFLDYSTSKFNSLINTNSHENAIDVYLTGSGFGSLASGIPGSYYVGASGIYLVSLVIYDTENIFQLNKKVIVLK